MRINRKVLVVENEDTWINVATQLLTAAGYYVKTAKDFESAINLLNTELFHIALVDLELAGGPPGNYYGISVLEEIHKRFPDCYRLIYTVHGQDAPIKIIESLTIPKMTAQGCFLKNVSPNQEILNFVNNMWDVYIKINHTLDIIPHGFDLDKLLKEKFLNKDENGGKLEILRESFLSVVARLFYGDNEMKELIIEPFKKGYSQTILFKVTAKSTLLKNRPGKQVIIKFGLKDTILKESNNFDKYVQWYLTLNQTTQKISVKCFNNYAAILFTFAGDLPENIFTFTDYLNENPDIKNKKSDIDFDLSTEKCIQSMFSDSVSRREWYHPEVIEKKQFIGDYYISVLDRPSHQLNEEFFEKQILKSDKAKMNLKNNKSKLIFTDINYEVLNPLNFCQNIPFADEYSTCIIHGDLNGDNIVVSSEGNFYLIDYAHTGRGHVFQDFINLELSIRDAIFWRRNIHFTFQEILDFEKSIIDRFDYSDTDNLDNNTDEKIKYITKANHLIRLIRKQAILNFPDEPQKLYLVGLFYMALDWITYHKKIEQKRHIILLTGLLAEKLEVS